MKLAAKRSNHKQSWANASVEREGGTNDAVITRQMVATTIAPTTLKMRVAITLTLIMEVVKIDSLPSSSRISDNLLTVDITNLRRGLAVRAGHSVSIVLSGTRLVNVCTNAWLGGINNMRAFATDLLRSLRMLASTNAAAMSLMLRIHYLHGK